MQNKISLAAISMCTLRLDDRETEEKEEVDKEELLKFLFFLLFSYIIYFVNERKSINRKNIIFVYIFSLYTTTDPVYLYILIMRFASRRIIFVKENCIHFED